ncbi:hypothetical protein Tco_0405359 [Tanacetum coccineum]
MLHESAAFSVVFVVPKLGSYALGYKVIVILDKHKISSGKSSSSGNLGSGRDTLTVGKISSSGNHITSSGNALTFYSQQSSPKLDTSSERIFKKKAKNDQSRARNGKDKVKPKPKSENQP